MTEVNSQNEIKGLLFFHSETGTEGGYWTIQDSKYISEDGKQWSYDGMHILENGDVLTIFSQTNPQKIIWTGEIHLLQFAPFTAEVFGFWTHGYQIGVEMEAWAKYFFENYPASVILPKSALKIIENLDFQIREIKINAEKNILELEKEKTLAVKYPDLTTKKSHCYSEVYCTKQANERTDKWGTSSGCSSCCYPVPFQVWPYVEEDGFKLHSWPTGFVIGDDNGDWIDPADNWDHQLINARIPQKMIEEIRQYLKEHSEENYQPDGFD